MATDAERRQAQRYRIDARVIIHRADGERVPGVVADISGSGLSVRPDRPCPIQVGEALTVEVEFSGHSDKPLPRWGVGRVVRLDGDRIALQLAAASFADPAPPLADDLG
jgi:hypothetical protein